MRMTAGNGKPKENKGGLRGGRFWVWSVDILENHWVFWTRHTLSASKTSTLISFVRSFVSSPLDTYISCCC